MEFIDITEKQKEEYNYVVSHPLQSYEWGEFRKKTGVKVIRKGLLKNGKIIDGFTLTIHKIPKTIFNIGYLPKGNLPTERILEELKRIGQENRCIFIQLEPDIEVESVKMKNDKLFLNSQLSTLNLKASFHPLFTKYTFVLDLTKSEEELLKSFHPKTRYNIKVAQKHEVKVEEDNSDKTFNNYLNLTLETTARQRFYAHSTNYHKKMWETLSKKNRGSNRTFAYCAI